MVLKVFGKIFNRLIASSQIRKICAFRMGSGCLVGPSTDMHIGGAEDAHFVMLYPCAPMT